MLSLTGPHSWAWDYRWYPGKLERTMTKGEETCPSVLLLPQESYNLPFPTSQFTMGLGDDDICLSEHSTHWNERDRGIGVMYVEWIFPSIPWLVFLGAAYKSAASSRSREKDQNITPSWWWPFPPVFPDFFTLWKCYLYWENNSQLQRDQVLHVFLDIDGSGAKFQHVLDFPLPSLMSSFSLSVTGNLPFLPSFTPGNCLLRLQGYSHI